MESKRSVLVTGCSDGSLGSALAMAFDAAGWRVFASARNLSKLAAAKAANIECVQLDVVSEDSISKAVEYVRNLTGGSLDALINNAGLGYSMPVIDTDMEKFHELMEINVYPIVNVTRAFLPLLLASTRSDAIIVNNTSGMGLLGCAMPFHGGYAASKAAAASLTESLRLELAPFGIRVVNLLTGRVKSTFFQNSNNAELPADSIYNMAKVAIEGPMNGRTSISNREDAADWAKNVVKDISKSRPPHMIYRGGQAGSGCLASVAPIGTFDRLFKKWSGLSTLEEKLREKKSA